MIVLTEQRVVIVTPPKTGSSSFHFAFGGFPGAWHVQGPMDKNDPESIELHTWIVPRAFRKKYKLAILVRNPYTRANSLYAHNEKYSELDFTIPYDAYMKDLGDQLEWFYWPLHRYLNNAQQVNEMALHDSPVIRLESVREDLAKLGVILQDFPNINIIGGAKTEMAEHLKPHVQRWAGEDFELGGYTK